MAAFFCAVAGVGAALSPGLPNLPRSQVTASRQQPNIVLIVLDTVRADHTSLYGYERDTTPYLRDLAGEATLYRHAVSVADQTLPTHASIFTGLYPKSHGAFFAPPDLPLGRPLQDQFTTMAEILRAKGYRTMAVVANTGYLAPPLGLTQGFEVVDWRAPLKVEASFRMYPRYLRKTVGELFDRFVSTAALELVVRRAGEINRAANQLVDQAGPSPYFLFINYMDAHMLYVPPEPFRSTYPCKDMTRRSVAGMHAIRVGVVTQKRMMTPDEEQCFVAQYDAGIAYIDSELRKLVASLKMRGQFENTLLIVTADHGEALGQRNLIGHGGVSVYQDEIGVPLLVKFPGRHASGVVDNYVSQVDFLPTVLDVVGIPPIPGLPGRSMRDIPGSASRPLVSVSFPDQSKSRANPQFGRTEEALVFDGRKLVVSTLGKHELFDLKKDRDEKDNLYETEESQAASLTAMLDQWNRTIPASRAKSTFTGDRGTIERLKSLGYVQ